MSRGRKSKPVILTDKEREYLEQQTRARTIQAQTVTRAKILLLRAAGVTIENIAEKVDLNRKSVMLCINKFHEGGIQKTWFMA